MSVPRPRKIAAHFLAIFLAIFLRSLQKKKNLRFCTLRFENAAIFLRLQFFIGSVFGRTDFPRNFIFEQPDFSRISSPDIFSFSWEKVPSQILQENPPAKSSKIYATKIPDTFLQGGWLGCHKWGFKRWGFKEIRGYLRKKAFFLRSLDFPGALRTLRKRAKKGEKGRFRPISGKGGQAPLKPPSVAPPSLSIFWGYFRPQRLFLFSKVVFRSARKIPFKTRSKIAL